jgi:hypothetical protein
MKITTAMALLIVCMPLTSIAQTASAGVSRFDGNYRLTKDENGNRKCATQLQITSKSQPSPVISLTTSDPIQPFTENGYAFVANDWRVLFPDGGGYAIGAKLDFEDQIEKYSDCKNPAECLVLQAVVGRHKSKLSSTPEKVENYNFNGAGRGSTAEMKTSLELIANGVKLKAAGKTGGVKSTMSCEYEKSSD